MKLFCNLLLQLTVMINKLHGLLGLSAIALVFYACSSEIPKNESGGSVTTQYISIVDNGFSPDNLTGASKLSIGTSITFVNQTDVAHTIVSDDTITFPARTIQPAKYAIYKKDTIGVFQYHCKEHPTVRGKIEFRF